MNPFSAVPKGQWLITGGTGFLGRNLALALLEANHNVVVLTRSSKRAKKLLPASVMLIEDLAALPSDYQLDGVINLAGAPIANYRWSEHYKKLILNSRLMVTEKLLSWLTTREQKPRLLLSGSAIGFYGDTKEAEADETTPAYPGFFSSQLCEKWEACARKAEDLGMRVVLLRTGLVLGAKGGFLQQILLPIRCFLGMKLGKGQQWMSWIHLKDWLGLVALVLRNDAIRGPINLTAPTPVRHHEFFSAIAKAVDRPLLGQLPIWMVKCSMGQMGEELLLASQKVLPQKALKIGYTFQFPELKMALQDLLARQQAPL